MTGSPPNAPGWSGQTADLDEKQRLGLHPAFANDAEEARQDKHDILYGNEKPQTRSAWLEALRKSFIGRSFILILFLIAIVRGFLPSSTVSESHRKTHVATPYEVQTPPLDTDWTYKLGKHPWPEHPRPLLRRDAWKSLNGIWTWRAEAQDDPLKNPPRPGPLDREVLVPSCIESGLSGLQELDVSSMWFQTKFDVPSSWKGRKLLLNFEAVDYESTVFVNGNRKPTHTGGYDRFTIDVTNDVRFGHSNDL